jgi:hypothetical protein
MEIYIGNPWKKNTCYFKEMLSYVKIGLVSITFSALSVCTVFL